HLGLTYNDVLEEYIVHRPSADGYHVGWIRKVTDDVTDNCVFLKGTGSGKYYCGIYAGRPNDCRDFTPIGCQDVDDSIPRDKALKIGPPFQPKHRRPKGSRRR
ncbi:MAG: YkgJ family cysteine cluster protein, partial [Rhodanobacteraceae bacterium]